MSNNILDISTVYGSDINLRFFTETKGFLPEYIDRKWLTNKPIDPTIVPDMVSSGYPEHAGVKFVGWIRYDSGASSSDLNIVEDFSDIIPTKDEIFIARWETLGVKINLITIEPTLAQPQQIGSVTIQRSLMPRVYKDLLPLIDLSSVGYTPYGIIHGICEFNPQNTRHSQMLLAGDDVDLSFIMDEVEIVIPDINEMDVLLTQSDFCLFPIKYKLQGKSNISDIIEPYISINSTQNMIKINLNELVNKDSLVNKLNANNSNPNILHDFYYTNSIMTGTSFPYDMGSESFTANQESNMKLIYREISDSFKGSCGYKLDRFSSEENKLYVSLCYGIHMDNTPLFKPIRVSLGKVLNNSDLSDVFIEFNAIEHKLILDDFQGQPPSNAGDALSYLLNRIRSLVYEYGDRYSSAHYTSIFKLNQEANDNVLVGYKLINPKNKTIPDGDFVIAAVIRPDVTSYSSPKWLYIRVKADVSIRDGVIRSTLDNNYFMTQPLSNIIHMVGDSNLQVYNVFDCKSGKIYAMNLEEWNSFSVTAETYHLTCGDSIWFDDSYNINSGATAVLKFINHPKITTSIPVVGQIGPTAISIDNFPFVSTVAPDYMGDYYNNRSFKIPEDIIRSYTEPIPLNIEIALQDLLTKPLTMTLRKRVSKSNLNIVSRKTIKGELITNSSHSVFDGGFIINELEVTDPLIKENAVVLCYNDMGKHPLENTECYVDFMDIIQEEPTYKYRLVFRGRSIPTSTTMVYRGDVNLADVSGSNLHMIVNYTNSIDRAPWYNPNFVPLYKLFNSNRTLAVGEYITDLIQTEWFLDTEYVGPIYPNPDKVKVLEIINKTPDIIDVEYDLYGVGGVIKITKKSDGVGQYTIKFLGIEHEVPDIN